MRRHSRHRRRNPPPTSDGDYTITARGLPIEDVIRAALKREDPLSIPIREARHRFAIAGRSSVDGKPRLSLEEIKARARICSMTKGKARGKSKDCPSEAHILTNSAKIEKGSKLKYISSGIYLSPSTSGKTGYNVCSGASTGCINECINKSGQYGTTAEIPESRRRRTQALVSDPAAFVRVVLADIANLAKALKKKPGFKGAIRLNGFSDIAWENAAPVILKTAKRHRIRVYDYTKRLDRKPNPKLGYHLSRSHSEWNQLASKEKLDEYLSRGENVVIPFAIKPKRGKNAGGPMLTEYQGHPVVDGDVTDLRFLDPKGVVVGLRAKPIVRPKRGSCGYTMTPGGGSTTGFIVDPNRPWRLSQKEREDTIATIARLPYAVDALKANDIPPEQAVETLYKRGDFKLADKLVNQYPLAVKARLGRVGRAEVDEGQTLTGLLRRTASNPRRRKR